MGDPVFHVDDGRQRLEIEGSQVVHIAGGGPFLFYEKPVECADAVIGFAAVGKNNDS